MFKDVRYDDGLNRDGTGQVIQFSVTCGTAGRNLVTISTENTTGLVEGTELLWMRMRRCCILLYSVCLAISLDKNRTELKLIAAHKR